MASSREPVTIIIPAYNEESSIGDVIEKLEMVMPRAGLPHEIVIVDDGSVDETSNIAQRSGARVVRHEHNLGYGASLKTGIRAAQHELIVITDADGTYPVDRIPEMLEKLRTSDMVVGARINRNVDIPLVRRPAKWLLRRLARYITGEHIPDLNSGLRAFRRRFVEQYFSLLPDKFSFTTTLTVAALCDHYKISYLPIDYSRRKGKSKIVPWDFVSFVTLVLRLSMLFNPLKVFVPVSMFCFLFAGLKLLFDIALMIERADGFSLSLLTRRIVSITSLTLFLSGLQILLIGMMSEGLIRRFTRDVSSNYQSHWIKNLEKKPSRDDARRRNRNG